MSQKDFEKPLSHLLKRLASASSTLPSLSQEEVSLLANASIPTASRQSRSIAFLCISKYCDTVAQRPSSTPETITSHIYSTFEPYLNTTFIPDKEDQATGTESCLPITHLLGSLFPLSPDAIVRLLTTPLGDAGDALGILLEVAELPSPLQPALAELLIAAAGTKSGRQMVRSRTMEWLKGAMDYGQGNEELGVLCAVALSKMSREEDIVTTQTQSNEKNGLSNIEIGMDDETLCRKLMSHIQSSSPTPSPSSSSSTAITSTVEGLAILSLRPANKILLSSSPQFLISLMSLSPFISPKGGSLPVTPRGSMDLSASMDPVDNGLCYGLTTIFVNLTGPKVILSAEDQQIAKLRSMALSANKSKLHQNNDDNPDDVDDDEEVKKRTKAVLKAGIVGALSGLARSESRLVKEGLGRLCRNLVEDPIDRLPFIRDGGFKVLSTIVRDLLNASTTKPSSSSTNPINPSSVGEIDVLPCFQALSKMIITTPPNLLFPPPHLTTSLNSLTPLYHLLIHPSSNSLQRFEALMALTNLASIDPFISNKITEASLKPLKSDTSWKGSGREESISIVSKIEESLLDDNELIRRASTQLICNLVSCQKGYEYFSGEGQNKDSTMRDGRVKSRLNTLLVLSGIDDLQTRLAAGGALAIITESEKACNSLFSITSEGSSIKTTKSVWERVLTLLQPDEEEEYDDEGEKIPVISSTPSLPNPDLVLRGVIVLLNLITYTVNLSDENRIKGLQAIKHANVGDRLIGVVRLKGIGEEVLAPTVEALKMLKKAQN
ncbi:uncharacterized protein IL334_002767 [Kwoniella shivajii]|uniref:UNC-45/Cro1/She4 central domain-containing protein n=1 Tax=Kwoniella shivajii TaxID=564305 RepID=A0ABZ1CW95_9TREE|nr:hypothetical protein IL334_002767 [Kwoniella shivajii]